MAEFVSIEQMFMDDWNVSEDNPDFDGLFLEWQEEKKSYHAIANYEAERDYPMNGSY